MNSLRFKIYAIVFIILFIPLTVRAEPVKILAFGDSLTAGYGLDADQAYPEKLAMRLERKGYDIEMVNAGISGDTTTGGLNRLKWTLKQNPDIVLLALGANDALRFIDPSVPRKNLDDMLSILQERNIPTVLLGMYAPRNAGAAYTGKFDAIYPDLAKKYDVAAYYPFILEGVAMNPDLNLEDRVHPNDRGTDIMADNLLSVVEPLVKRQQNK